MKSPVGMEEIDPGSSSEDCFKLVKGINGLCQPARQFLEKVCGYSKKGTFWNPIEPCRSLNAI